MITVHHLRHSRSQRIPWLLEEMGVDYRIVAHDRVRGLAPPSLKAVHPLGKAPVIEDDGRVIAESGAIIHYLLDRHDSGSLGMPADTSDRQSWTYWMHYAEGSLMPLVVLGMILGRMERAPWLIRPLMRRVVKPVRDGYLEPNVERHLDWVDGTLATQTWFAGPTFSAADIQMSVPLLALAGRTGEGTTYPHIDAFLARIRERPAFQRAHDRMQLAEKG